MLTENEKQWLKHRERACPDGKYFCDYCDIYAECHSDMGWDIECPTAPLIGLKHEAIAFEQRVAAKLAKGYPNRECINWETNYECPGWDVCKHCPTAHTPCAFAALKGARLAVEEEMDAR